MGDKKSILLIDDDPEFVSLLQRKMNKLNCKIDTAYDGDEGIKKARSNPPDLIVLDVMMPVKDGFQTCKELKADPSSSEIPVILLTAVADHIADTSYSQHDAMSIEADEYVPKGPDCSEQVLECVQDFLEL